MNTAIATRLLWKEYRQQRNLWIALLFGATLLQLIFWYFIDEPRPLINGGGVRPDETTLLPLHVGTATMMTALFAVCSAAISFAIEREEGTHLRLVSLSCPPGLTLGVKFLVGLLGTVLLFAVSVVIGAGLSVGVSSAIGVLGRWDSPDLIIVSYWVIAVVGGGLGFGAFCSLLFRKVLPAVIVAAVVMFVGAPLLFVEVVAEVVRHGNRGSLQREEVFWLMAILVTGIGVLGLIDFLLVRWWMNRGFSDSPRVRSRSLFRRLRVQRDGLDGSFTLEIGGADRAEFEVLAPEQARILPPPRLGLSLLYSNWGRGRSRVLRFLCWKEAAESRRLFLALLAGGTLLALCVGEAMRPVYWGDGTVQYQPRNEFAFLVMYGYLSMFVCGLMAFRGEQFGDSYQLLSDRGVTPGYVWLSKQLIWFSRLLLLYSVMLAVIAVFTRFGGANQILWILLGGNGSTGSFAVEWSRTNWVAGLFNFLTQIVVFYSIAQMASLAWRRAALSIFFSLLCCILIGMWVGVAINFDVPVVVAAFPMAIALLLLTRLRTRGWIIGDDRFKRWLVPGAVGFLGIAACWLTTAAYRVFEIPSARPIVATKTLADGSTAETINGLTESERAAILAPVSEEEKAAVALYGKYGTPSGPEALREAISLGASAFESPGSDTLLKTNITRMQMYVLGNHFLDAAKREVESGNAAGALSLIGDAFKVARHAAGRGADFDFNQWRIMTASAMQTLVAWSYADGVTAELVDEATELVREHVELAPNLFAVSFAHHQIVRNTLALAYDELATLRQRGESFDSSKYFEQHMSLKYPGTLWRIDRLVDWYEVRTAKLIAEADLISDRGPSAGQSLGTWYRTQLALANGSMRILNSPNHRQWLDSTPIPGHILDDIGVSLVFVRVTTEALARGAQVAMRLNLVRREGGELPESLDALSLPADVLIEPWSVQQFAWYPKGIPNEIESGTMVIPANTPFLFAGGPQGGYLEEIEEMIRVEGPFDPPARVIPLNDEGGVSAANPQADAGDAAAQDPVAKLSEPAAVLPEAAAPFGLGDLPGVAGGMGAASEPNVRWETRRRFVLKVAEPQTGPADVSPTVWLFPPDAAAPAVKDRSSN